MKRLLIVLTTFACINIPQHSQAASRMRMLQDEVISLRVELSQLREEVENIKESLRIPQYTITDKRFNVITREELFNIIITQATKGKAYSPQIFLTDGDKTILPLASMLEIVKESKVDQHPYGIPAEIYDCDDRGIQFQSDIIDAQVQLKLSASIAAGWCVGSVRGGYHMLNWFVDSDRKFWLVEPETDEIFEFDAATMILALFWS